MHNAEKTCWNCPAAQFAGVLNDLSSGCKSLKRFGRTEICPDMDILIGCRRQPDLGLFKPNITFQRCPEWEKTSFGYRLKYMRVMILGMDGYLGWPLALRLGLRGFEVSGIDNYSRRKWVGGRGSHSVVPISNMTERLKVANDELGININFRWMDIRDQSSLSEFIKNVEPEVIIHYAECPSAPFSMIDADHAVLVQDNNVLGTLRLLFLVRDIVPETSILKLGTMGEYGTPMSGRPLFEGVFPDDAILTWRGREWSMGGEMTPHDPGSFYHVSKVQDTVNIRAACKWWNLRSHDIMQGVIFGTDTPETLVDPRLRTRFDIDEWWGTAVNRMVAQAILGVPLTVYGEGGQTRGFIALEDAMNCMTHLICSPPSYGEYSVVNQFDGYYSILAIAKMVAEVGREDFGLDVQIQRVEDPRVEAEQHPYEPIADRLSDEFGVKFQVHPKTTIQEIFRTLMNDEIRSRIEQKRHLILPKTWWSGDKRTVQSLD